MKKLNSIRKNPEPARGQSGINPLDPWGAKAGINEEPINEISARASESDLLSRYLKARGINPEYVPKNTKVAHSKSSEFMKWKTDHANDRFESVMTTHSPTGKKIQEAYSLPTASDADHEHVKRHLSSVLGVHSKPEEKSSVPAVHRAIQKVSGISDSSTRRMSKDILKSLVQKHRIVVDKDHRQLLNKESTQINELSPATKASYKEKAKQTIAQLKPHAKSGEYKDIAQNIIKRREKGLSMAKEEIETANESSAYGRISSRFKTLSGRSLDAAAKEHGDEAKRLQKEIEAQQKEIDRRKAALKQEEVGQIDEVEKKEYSKSARIIKSIYKRKHMKEDMYDFEKGDKQQSQDDNVGDDRKRPKAKAIMTGGKTMTGQQRDNVEIDPEMARKPNPPDGFEKDYGKKSV